MSEKNLGDQDSIQLSSSDQHANISELKLYRELFRKITDIAFVVNDEKRVEPTSSELNYQTQLAQNKLLHQKNIAQQTLETIMEGVIRIDENLNIQYANKVSEQICGFKLNSMVNMPVAYALNLYTTDDEFFSVEQALQDAIDAKEVISIVSTPLRLQNRAKQNIYIELCFSPTFDLTGNKSEGGIIAFKDVTEKYTKINDLLWSSTHDSLTELINRNEMERRLQHAIGSSKRNGMTSSLLFMDLDQFKVVNDVCGHQAGDMLLLKADSACYLAKESGRNTIQVYTETNEEMEEKRSHLNAITDINEALDSDGFSIFMQAITDVNQSQKQCWEVLVRMNKSQSAEPILPGHFLPAAERFNLSSRIDMWVLNHTIRSVCGLAKKHQKHVPSLHINVSGATLISSSYVNRLKELLDLYQLDPSTLCFELTETAAMSHYMKAGEFIDQVRSLGCKFALDDFGKGMSSLSYLNELSLDVVKIDSSFVKDILSDKVKSEIVKSVSNIARLLDLELVAEGVETPQQLDHLSELGVQQIQGFLFAKPVSLDEFSQLAFEQ